MAQWWYAEGGKRQGPVEVTELQRLIQAGTLDGKTLVWTTGQGEWVSLETIPDLKVLLDSGPPPLPPELIAALDNTLYVAGPWRRYFARTLDLILSVVFAVALFLLLVLLNPSFAHSISTSKPEHIALLEIALLPIALIIDALIYKLFGNTLGKAILRVAVRKADTAALGFGDYLARNFRLWLSGLGFGIPVLALIPAVYQARRLYSGKPASYDEKAGDQVLAPRIGISRWVGFAGAFVCTVFLFGFVTQFAAIVSPARQAATPTKPTEAGKAEQPVPPPERAAVPIQPKGDPFDPSSILAEKGPKLPSNAAAKQPSDPFDASVILANRERWNQFQDGADFSAVANECKVRLEKKYGVSNLLLQTRDGYQQGMHKICYKVDGADLCPTVDDLRGAAHASLAFSVKDQVHVYACEVSVKTRKIEKLSESSPAFDRAMEALKTFK